MSDLIRHMPPLRSSQAHIKVSSRDLGEIGASSAMTGVAAAGGYPLAFIGGLILSAVALGAVASARRSQG